MMFKCLSVAALGVAATTTAIEYPATLSLKAGVLLAPPFAIKDDNGEYTGFQPDLLDALVTFAAQDGTDLTFELSDAPAQYNEALNRVATDCGEMTNNTAEECEEFDMIIGDYFVNADRSVRTLFTAAWLHTSMGALRIASGEFDSLQELEDGGGTVCVPEGTLVATVVAESYPGATTNECAGVSGCIAALKAEECSLYVDDTLLLQYQMTLDSDLMLTDESFNTQYLVWPTKFPYSDTTTILNRWLYTAVAEGTLDELFDKYFGGGSSGPTPSSSPAPGTPTEAPGSPTEAPGSPTTEAPTTSPAGYRHLSSLVGAAASFLFF